MPPTSTPCPDGNVYDRLTKLELRVEDHCATVDDLRSDVYGKPGESGAGLRGDMTQVKGDLGMLKKIGWLVLAAIVGDFLTRLIGSTHLGNGGG